MKILLVHNFYGSSAPSGENQVFDAERSLLKQRGHDVETFTRHSDEIRNQGSWGIVKGALATPWNPFMARALRNKIKKFKPDVVHVHNSFPLLSPAIFHAIGALTAGVLTLHNYRLFCPAGIPMREGKVCTVCLDSSSSLPSIQYGCYRQSRLATIPLAFSVGLHRLLGTWKRHVDGFITLSEFQRLLMTAAGLPESRVHVKPNFFPGAPPVKQWHEHESYIVFVGRLSKEKGVINLLRAWQAWGSAAPELRLIGDGELRQQLEMMAKNLPVRFFGQIPSTEAQAQIANAKMLILPSECFETFGLVVVEAFAFGTPTAVSNLGPLATTVENSVSGVVFKPCNPESLLNVVRSTWENPELLEKLGHGARKAFEAKYTENMNYEKLMTIYEKAIAENQEKIKS